MFNIYSKQQILDSKVQEDKEEKEKAYQLIEKWINEKLTQHARQDCDSVVFDLVYVEFNMEYILKRKYIINWINDYNEMEDRFWDFSFSCERTPKGTVTIVGTSK